MQAARAQGATLELTFQALDREIRGMPDGPTGHRRPRWMTPLQGVGALGVIVGVLPSLLILKMEPTLWMVLMARAGVVVSLLAWAPQLLFDTYWIARSLRNWRSEQTRTMDHEFRQFGKLQAWLATFPQQGIEEHARFAAMAHARITAKLGFMGGGADKLAVIPLLVLLVVQAKVFQDFASVPAWQIYVAIFAALLYAIAIVAHLMKLRLSLYEAVLSEALVRRAAAPDRDA